MNVMSLGVFRAIVNGVEGRGDDGFLYVKGERCVYMKLPELENKDFRDALQEILANDEGEHFYIVTETGGRVDIMAYTRERVYEDVKNDELKKLQEATSTA